MNRFLPYYLLALGICVVCNAVPCLDSGDSTVFFSIVCSCVEAVGFAIIGWALLRRRGGRRAVLTYLAAGLLLVVCGVSPVTITVEGMNISYIILAAKLLLFLLCSRWVPQDDGATGGGMLWRLLHRLASKKALVCAAIIWGVVILVSPPIGQKEPEALPVMLALAILAETAFCLSAVQLLDAAPPLRFIAWLAAIPVMLPAEQPGGCMETLVMGILLFLCLCRERKGAPAPQPGGIDVERIDHLVITTADLARCLEFYVGALGMRHEVCNGRHALFFGNQKINIHTAPGQYQPAAAAPTPGSADLCLIVRNDWHSLTNALLRSPFKPISSIEQRTGALGPMQSLYLRDPDGNLIELSRYVDCSTHI